MPSMFKPTLSNMFATIITLWFAVLATAQNTGFTQSYCSSQNTGTGDAYFWTYQSNGQCTDHCKGLGTFAFAVIQENDCWCSNYIPSTTTDITNCQKDCPGYPAEKCGDESAGVYIYIKMDGQPSGTAGGDSQPSSTSVSSAAPVPSSTASPSSDAVTRSAPPSQRPTSRGRPPVTIIQTVVGDSPTIIVTSTPRQISAALTFTTHSSSSAQQSSTLKTIATSSATAPSTSVQVVTESGAVVTRTVIYQPSEAAQQTSTSTSTSTSSSGSSNTGAIVGGVVGGVAAIAAVVGGILFFMWRRKKQQRAEQEHQAGITRNTSTMSKSGLLGGRSVATDPHYPPPIATNFGKAGSRHDNESISPISGSQRRYSQPMMIDSRLNPETVLMYHPTFANSRESLGSIDDSRDYGRQLNVRNPDPH